MFNRFAGDPAVQITDNGASMTFKGGQPVMDQGIENAVLISLFTKPGYWGNALETEDSKKIGSNFEQIRTVVDLDTITEITQDAEDALSALQESGLIEDIDVTITNPYTDQIYANIKIYPPGEDLYNFIFTNNGASWIGQKYYPANERL